MTYLEQSSMIAALSLIMSKRSKSTMTNILPNQRSYPNQKIITIHKPQYKENFL